MNFLNKLVHHDLASDNLPAIKYLNLSIVNGDPFGSASSVSLRFLEHRSTPFLDSPQDYYASIIRFKIDTLSLPVMQAQAQIGQSDVNKLNYSFTMSYDGQTFQQFIEYAPADLSASLPQPPLTTQDLSTGYYNMYSYQHFIDLCNVALQDCFTGLNALVTLPTTLAPWITFDTTSKDITFNVDAAAFADSVSDPIELFMNASCHSLFSSFQCTYFGDVGIEDGKNFQFVLKNRNQTNVYELDIGSVTYNILHAYQEDDCVALWNPVQSIVICSSTLPIEGTMIASPKIFNSAMTSYNSSQNVSTPILSDFQASEMLFRSYVEYSPYYPRLIEMYSRTSQSSISIECYWMDVYNNMNPLMLPPNCSANIKIAFYKK